MSDELRIGDGVALVSEGGEVQPCPHEFHDAVTPSQPTGRTFSLT